MSELAGPHAIGEPPWSRLPLDDLMEEFVTLYENRPIRDNAGGMRAPHMFATFAILRSLQPEVVIESGVWKGAGTWLIEEAVPDAQVFALDPNLERLVYRSSRVTYSTRDFNHHDWSGLPKRTVAFFDDHQSALERLQQCRWHSVHDAIFEDNYPPGQGDCFSLKKLFSGSGFTPPQPGDLRDRLRQLLRCSSQQTAVPEGESQVPAAIRNLEIYAEFPPVVRSTTTRWGDAWTDSRYPTVSSLREFSDSQVPEVFRAEAGWYTWIAFARLSSTMDSTT